MRQILRADDPSWSVWLDWYDERLRGAAPDQGRELARVTALTKEDYEKGAVHMNRRVMAALEEYERERTPTSDKLELDPGTKRMERRDEEPQEIPSKPAQSKAEFFAELRGEIAPVMRDIQAETEHNTIMDLEPALTRRWNRMHGADTPRVWLVGIEIMKQQIDGRVSLDDRRRIPDQIAELLAVIESQELELQDKFPEEAKVQNARRLQNQNALTVEQLAALGDIIDTARAAMSPEVQEGFDALIHGEGDDGEPVDLEGVEPTSVANRDRLYRIKAMFLRLRYLTGQSTEKLMQALDVVKRTDEAVVRIERIQVAFEKVWDKISSFLLGG